MKLRGKDEMKGLRLEMRMPVVKAILDVVDREESRGHLWK